MVILMGVIVTPLSGERWHIYGYLQSGKLMVIRSTHWPGSSTNSARAVTGSRSVSIGRKADPLTWRASTSVRPFGSCLKMPTTDHLTRSSSTPWTDSKSSVTLDRKSALSPKRVLPNRGSWNLTVWNYFMTRVGSEFTSWFRFPAPIAIFRDGG